MGSGKKGLYIGTRGDLAVPGSIDFMLADEYFSKYIKKRKDVDPNGFYDVIAHGEETLIQIQNNGAAVMVDHRIIAKLLKNTPEYKHGPVRLLSCSTGKIDDGFAQNLANKLNRPVKAPTDFLWVFPDGKYFVAGVKVENGVRNPDMNKLGRFRTFYPKRKRRKK